MTVAYKNTANCIDEAIVIILIVNESIVHKLLQCLDITPIVRVIRLHSVYPIKDPSYPSHCFGRHVRCTSCLWIFAEIYARKSPFSSFIVSSLSKIVVESSNVTDAFKIKQRLIKKIRDKSEEKEQLVTYLASKEHLFPTYVYKKRGNKSNSELLS